MRYAYKRLREHGRRMAAYRGEFPPNNPVFPAGSAAAIPASSQDVHPVAIDAPDIVYTAEDDAAIDKFLKAQSRFLYGLLMGIDSEYKRYSH